MNFCALLSARRAGLVLTLGCLGLGCPVRAQTPAATPPAAPVATAATPAAPAKPGPGYIAVLSSFPEELAAIEKVLVPDTSKLQTTHLNGLDFSAADIDGRHYLFLVTGMSLVNAAMNTQLALDHFHITAVYFTGIAGGIDPAFSPGDVVVPAHWSYHSEAAYFNETAPGQFALAGYFHQKYANFGMIFPDEVTVKREGMPDWAQVPFFPADDKLLAAAKKAIDAMPPLKLGDRVCKVVCGGNGVSGTVFCDNAEYRKWIFTVWQAECVDMESAAIAQVCWENRVPCLLVRGLSDLAGGQAGANEEEVYLKAAADHSAEVLETILRNAPLPAAP
jgi:adenosylhomocysteine nucleosidase